MTERDLTANRLGFTDYGTLLTCAYLLCEMHVGAVRRELLELLRTNKTLTLARTVSRYIKELHQ
jgi:hypothetical protein